MSNPAETVLDLLLAAMDDAAMTGELTQFQMQIRASEGDRLKIVRVIVAPEAPLPAGVRVSQPDHELVDRLVDSMRLGALGKLSQLLFAGQPFRIIVVPEKMDVVAPPGAPFGTPHS